LLNYNKEVSKEIKVHETINERVSDYNYRLKKELVMAKNIMKNPTKFQSFHDFSRQEIVPVSKVYDKPLHQTQI
jgi:ABC-type Na+ transport system ATPase subunit NatA